MSLFDEIEKWCKGQTLFVYEPFSAATPRVRTIVVTADLHKFILGPWHSEHEEALSRRMQLDLDRFVSGRKWTVALQPKKRNKRHQYPDANMKRLPDEVWEIRVRGSIPQQRVFGRFAAQDVFVALFWENRPKLNYPQARQRCVELPRFGGG